MYSALYNHIKILTPTFEKEINNVLSFFEQKTFPKDHVIIEEKSTVDSFYFVNKGILQMYYTDHFGKKNTIHFAIENWWITDYNSFLGNPSAEFNIATLEETEVMVIEKIKFDQLLLEFPFMALYFNKIHMKAYGAALFKQKSFSTVSKKDFHYYFKTKYPELIKRIPHEVMASYLEISNEELTFFDENLRS